MLPTLRAGTPGSPFSLESSALFTLQRLYARVPLVEKGRLVSALSAGGNITQRAGSRQPHPAFICISACRSQSRGVW